MKTWTITNRISGQDLGIYEATDEAGALEAMAIDAGYATYREACEVNGDDPGDGQLVVKAAA